MSDRSASNDKILILASLSPRRRTLLEQSGVPIEVIPPDVEEDILEGEKPWEIVERLSRAKADAVAARYPDRFVLAADTIVVLPETERRILGKPHDIDDARAMLKMIQARKHEVYTGFSLLCEKKKICITKNVKTIVHLAAMSGEDIEQYLKSGESLDKAGAYALQGRGGAYVDTIEGSYSNVIGLPMSEVRKALKAVGLWS